MKVILCLLYISIIFNACSNNTTINSEDMIKQTDIIPLVNDNDIEAVKDALEEGSNVDTEDANKRSLLLIATVNQYTDMAEMLVSYGADVNQQDDNLDSPFLYAGASGQTELVKLYLSNGARFDIFNRYNGTALIPACERGHVETVKVLAETDGFPINHVNRLGWTALMEAVVLGDGSKKYQEIVQILKDNGADLNIPDLDGKTPLQHASEKGFTEIARILSAP